MSPRPTLTLKLGLLAVTALVMLPGAVAAGPDGAMAPSERYAAQPAAGTPGKGAKGEAAPRERKAPPPAPRGCPLRNGKLELIV